MSDNPGNTYDIGYKKPPTATRYQKGKSGNLNGRPKKVDDPLDAGSILQAIESEKITILLENGKRKRITKSEAYLRQLFQTAVAGDMKSARLLVDMAGSFLAPEAKADFQTKFIGESEAVRRFGEDYRRKIEKLNAGTLVEPTSTAGLFRKVARAKVVLEIGNDKRTMTNWEAVARNVQQQALLGNSNAVRILTRMRKKFPGKPVSDKKYIDVLSDNEMNY